MSMTGAESFLQTALKAGVDTCFTNPGTTEMDLVATLDHTPEMRTEEYRLPLPWQRSKGHWSTLISVVRSRTLPLRPSSHSRAALRIFGSCVERDFLSDEGG